MSSKLTKLAGKIAKIEGKKSQARIGDIREILKIIATLISEESDFGAYDGREMGETEKIICDYAEELFQKNIRKMLKSKAKENKL